MEGKTIFVIVILFIVFLLGFFLFGNTSEIETNDFDEIWKLDGVVLMQHETSGLFGCFGCGETICVDPIQEMKLVSETEERYCNEDFEVVENGNLVEGNFEEESEQEKSSTKTDCEETKFNYPPVNLDKTRLAVPLGLMSGNHVTPIDHMYFQDFSNDEANIEVYSPGKGTITNMQHMFGSYFRNQKEIKWEDYRLIIEHDCDISSIFIHIDKLSDKLKEVAPNKGENSWPNIDVGEGEILGWYMNNVDYNLVDQNVLLDGLLVAEHYDSEPWKVHTPSDQYNYFNDEIKNKLIEKSLRHEAPYSGKFDWDVDGTLQGNWFVEGSKGYDGIVGQQYWETHLSFSPDYLDYDHFIISMGDFNGQQKQFGAKGNKPKPLDVSIETGVVTYELVDFDFFTEGGERWDRQSLEVIKEVKNSEQISGTVLVQMIEDRKIRFEVFPDKTMSQISGFTDNAIIYIR